MVQNYTTLKDYLIGFTLFKQLLQFANDEIEEEPIKTGKGSKKSINVNKIIINYANEILITKKLIVEKEMSSNGYLV